MRDFSRPVSLGLFVLVLLCFLLPFARVSCSSSDTKNGAETRTVETVVQATGYEVAFGKRIAASEDESWEAEARKPDFVAIAAVFATLVGIGLVLVRGRRGAIARAILSGHGLLLLLALWGELSCRVRPNDSAQLQMLGGYWVAFALFLVAGLANLLAIRRAPRAGP